ncbi:DUF2785 domain-containing protein [Paenibacillus rhizophilus]|nr:DUF2785 domain-containing protein [Paenibacillus rhizophilus]
MEEEQQDVWTLVQQKVILLGSPDSEIREEAYSALFNWLLEENALGKSQMEELLQQSVSDSGLFYGIGEKETDSVFKRTFTSLLIALLLTCDNRKPYLTRESYDLALKALIRYCHLEDDFRGYVEVKGWAHAAAHVADALDECAMSRYAGAKECTEIWTGVQALLERPAEVYQREEDERLATAIVSMIQSQKVSFATICEWLGQMEPARTKSVESYTLNTNRKHFLRCLYTRLYDQREKFEETGMGLNRLLELEKRFNRFRLQA